MKNNLFCIILGTRPEIIKTAPVIKELSKKKQDYFILHTGQHYDKEMDDVFFRELGIGLPKYNLGIGSRPYGKQIGFMIKDMIKILKKENPSMVIVQGDTSSVLAGALAAVKLGIKVVHHEAGLRSYDMRMQEEINRIIVDHISDFLMAPTKTALINLKTEGVDSTKIFYTGNTIVDSVRQNSKIADKIAFMKKLKLKSKKYILVTCHRAENVDKKERLKNILESIDLVHREVGLPLVLPMHPRTKKKIFEFGLLVPSCVTVIEPVGFFEFLQLEKNAKIIMTDSGGVQEEACILGVPCITMRDNTERPETIKCGANIISGTSPQKILLSAKSMMNRKSLKKCQNIFGDGHAAEDIVKIILSDR